MTELEIAIGIAAAYGKAQVQVNTVYQNIAVAQETLSLLGQNQLVDDLDVQRNQISDILTVIEVFAKRAQAKVKELKG